MRRRRRAPRCSTGSPGTTAPGATRSSAATRAEARRWRSAIASALLLALGARARAGELPAARDAEASFDYLYVEANEGSSSGGHAALRFGDDVYHFQHHGGGLLRLHREDAAAFLHHYARLENRAVHVRRVALDADARERLRHGFAERFLLEEAQNARLDALRDDLAALDALLDGTAPVLHVGGARFFAPPAHCATDAVGASGTVAEVARRIEERHPGLLAQRRAATESALRSLTWTRAGAAADGAVPPAPDPHRLLSADPPVVAQATDLVAAMLALDVLCSGTPLLRDTLRGDPDTQRDGPVHTQVAPRDARVGDRVALPDARVDDEIGELLRLGDGERQALRAFAIELRERAVDLATSRRPDWGSALLLALARLAAVEESTASGGLVVLDAYASDVATLSPEDVRAQQPALPELLREAGAQLAAARRPLAGGRVPRELEYSALEAAVNRYLELSRASLAGAALRLEPGALVVSGDAAVPLPAALVGVDRATLRAARAAAHARLAADEEALRVHGGYDLLRRNCVSELFREIARALRLAPEAGAPALRGETLDCSGSLVALGGCVDPGERLRFIPFISADAVDQEYRVSARDDVPSFRTAALDAMRRDEARLAVGLRESNVVSSTLYRARDEDSVFLFFTDDQPVLRPLLGVANLASGVGSALAGVALLPADGGTLLARGLRGVLFSVPELGFVSIRKGTFAWAPRVQDDAS